MSSRKCSIEIVSWLNCTQIIATTCSIVKPTKLLMSIQSEWCCHKSWKTMNVLPPAPGWKFIIDGKGFFTEWHSRILWSEQKWKPLLSKCKIFDSSCLHRLKIDIIHVFLILFSMLLEENLNLGKEITNFLQKLIFNKNLCLNFLRLWNLYRNFISIC